MVNDTQLDENLEIYVESDTICISRQDIETLHRVSLSLAQTCRRLLGLPPLLTGKEIRRQQRKQNS